MIPSWRTLLSWLPFVAPNESKPLLIIDLTQDAEVLEVLEGPFNTRSWMVCPLCMSHVRKPDATLCGHVFCRVCIDEHLEISPDCPVCDIEMAGIVRLYGI